MRDSAPQHENCHHFLSKPVSLKVEQVCNNMMVQKPVSATALMDDWMVFFSQNCRKNVRIVKKTSQLPLFIFNSLVEIGFQG